MKRLFSMKRFKKKSYDEDDAIEAEDEYVELNTDIEPTQSAKITVRPFVIEEFSDIKAILDVLREGSTICVINIKPLKDKDLLELKRAVNKLKKTCEAIEGDIAGFGNDYIIAVPSIAEIYRGGNNTSTIE